MIALRFELSCPRCGAELDHDTTTAPTRPTATLSSLALACTGCGRRTIAVVSLITQDDDETTDPCPDNPSTTDPPN